MLGRLVVGCSDMITATSMVCPGAIYGEMGQNGFGHKSKRPTPKCAFKYPLANSHACTNSPKHIECKSTRRNRLNVYRLLFMKMRVTGKHEKLIAKGAAIIFMTRMFHCVYNKTDYAETQAAGWLTAGCSGPFKMI